MRAPIRGRCVAVQLQSCPCIRGGIQSGASLHLASVARKGNWTKWLDDQKHVECFASDASIERILTQAGVCRACTALSSLPMLLRKLRALDTLPCMQPRQWQDIAPDARRVHKAPFTASTAWHGAPWSCSLSMRGSVEPARASKPATCISLHVGVCASGGTGTAPDRGAPQILGLRQFYTTLSLHCPAPPPCAPRLSWQPGSAAACSTPDQLPHTAPSCSLTGLPTEAWS